MNAPDRPAGSYAFDLTSALLTVWMIGGAYLDSWAHSHLSSALETPFTPWHGVLYTGFMAGAAFLLIVWARNVRKGFSPLKAVPEGYGPSLIGVAIFFVGGVGDLAWHSFFGIEIGVEGALSATHQLLMVGAILIAAGPLRAAWRRPDPFGNEVGATPSPKQSAGLPRGGPGGEGGSWRDFLPTALSLLLVLSLLTLITQIAHPLVVIWASGDQPPDAERARFGFQVVGVVSGILQTVILMGIALLAIRRWANTLPPGLFTFIFTLNGAALSVMSDEYRLIPAMLLAGLTADALLIFLRPSAANVGAVRWFGLLVPSVLYGMYFVILALTDTLWWRIHTVSGAISGAAAAGLLLSILVFPPEVGENQDLR